MKTFNEIIEKEVESMTNEELSEILIKFSKKELKNLQNWMILKIFYSRIVNRESLKRLEGQ